MNRSLMFSPARSRLIAIASSRAMMRSCTLPSTSQICLRSFGSRANAASISPTSATTKIARLTHHRNQQRQAIVVSAWRGDDSSDDSDSNDHSPVGRIEIITGPMFSGKSTELLRRAAEHEVNSFFFIVEETGEKKERQNLTSTPPLLSLTYENKNRPPGAASPWSRARKTQDTASVRSSRTPELRG